MAEPTWQPGGTVEGDWRQKPVKNKVWLGLSGLKLRGTVSSGEVRVLVEQRDKRLYLTKTKTDVEGAWGPWSYSPKEDEADFRLTLQTMKKNTKGTYPYMLLKA